MCRLLIISQIEKNILVTYIQFWVLNRQTATIKLELSFSSNIANNHGQPTGEYQPLNAVALVRYEVQTKMKGFYCCVRTKKYKRHPPVFNVPFHPLQQQHKQFLTDIVVAAFAVPAACTSWVCSGARACWTCSRGPKRDYMYGLPQHSYVRMSLK